MRTGSSMSTVSPAFTDRCAKGYFSEGGKGEQGQGRSESSQPSRTQLLQDSNSGGNYFQGIVARRDSQFGARQQRDEFPP